MIPIACARRIDRPHPAVILCAPRGPAPAAEATKMERWNPGQEVTRQEQFILKRLEKKRKLFGFLRRHRHELFDEAVRLGCGRDCRDGSPVADGARLPGRH